MLVTTGDKSERLRPCVSSLGKGWIWVLLTSWCQEHDPQAAWPHSALNLRLQISFSERDDFKRKKKKNFFPFSTKAGVSVLEPRGLAPPQCLQVKMALLELKFSPSSNSKNCTHGLRRFLHGVGALKHLCWSPLPSTDPLSSQSQVLLTKGALSQEWSKAPGSEGRGLNPTSVALRSLGL